MSAAEYNKAMTPFQIDMNQVSGLSVYSDVNMTNVGQNGSFQNNFKIV